jgi:hypothetical protein
MLFSYFCGMHHALGRRSLEDIIRIMVLQMRALGHEAILDERNMGDEVGKHVYATRPDAINVLIEGFTPGWVEHLAKAKSMGARFMILATEEPTPKGFNWGTQKEMVRRQEIFPEAAKLCEGILHLVPGAHVTRWYGQFAPTAQAELGYAPTLMRLDNSEPEFDFGFFGSLSPRRLRILKKLAKFSGREKAVKIVADFLDGPERDRQMRRAKVIVQIRKFDKMGLVSSSRCNTALSIGRPVVPEPHDIELSKPWNKVIAFPQSDEAFYRNCLLAKSAWRGVWNDQVEKFKKELNPYFCIGEPLERIGIVKN